MGFSEEYCGHNANAETKPAEQRLDEKLFVLGSLLHASDISNPTKPRSIMLAWTRRILDEFWAQGDLEKSLGFTAITMFCDREADSTKIPARQLGFIDFVVEPYWRSLCIIAPDLQAALAQLTENRRFWHEQAALPDVTYKTL